MCFLFVLGITLTFGGVFLIYAGAIGSWQYRAEGNHHVVFAPAGNGGPVESGRRIQDAVRRQLGVPVEVVPVEGGVIPRTTSGKLQRQKLKKLFVSGRLRSLEGPARQPAEPVMGALGAVLAAWGEALGVPADRLGPASHFGELGGDSIQAAHVHALLEKACGRSLGHGLLGAATAGEMAGMLEEAAGGPASWKQERERSPAPGEDPGRPSEARKQKGEALTSCAVEERRGPFPLRGRAPQFVNSFPWRLVLFPLKFSSCEHLRDNARITVRLHFLILSFFFSFLFVSCLLV